MPARIADRFGARPVLIVGGLFYALGLALMSVAPSGLTFDLSAGLLIGLGLSGASFNLVLGAFAKLLPPKRLSYAFGAATAAGSFGQFLFSPLAGGLVANMGWETTCVIFAGVTALIVAARLRVENAARRFFGQRRADRRVSPGDGA